MLTLSSLFALSPVTLFLSTIERTLCIHIVSSTTHSLSRTPVCARRRNELHTRTTKVKRSNVLARALAMELNLMCSPYVPTKQTGSSGNEKSPTSTSSQKHAPTYSLTRSPLATLSSTLRPTARDSSRAASTNDRHLSIVCRILKPTTLFVVGHLFTPMQWKDLDIHANF